MQWFNGVIMELSPEVMKSLLLQLDPVKSADPNGFYSYILELIAFEIALS